MQNSSHYAMTELRLMNQAWIPTPSRIHVCLEIGRRFGVLRMQSSCTCGKHDVRHDYFFTMDEADHVRLHIFCPVKEADGRIVLRLPGFAHGRFVCNPTPSVDDAQILWTLAHRTFRENFSGRHMFGVLRRTICLRLAFRKLYFRCFRRSFAPHRNQGKRCMQEGVAFLDRLSKHSRKK